MAGEKSVLSAEDFLAGILGDPVPLTVPNLGTVMVRGLTLFERKSLAPLFKGEDNNADITLKVVAMGMVEPKLSEKDVERLWKADNAKLQVIGQKIMAMSAVPDEQDTLEKKVGSGSLPGQEMVQQI